MSKEKAHELTDEQVKIFTEVFKEFDHNNDGEITSKELGLILKSLGMQLTDTELTHLVNEVDVDGNGSIDTAEFLSMMWRKMKQAEEIKKGDEGLLREAFRIFDTNGDGLITVIELHLLTENLGEKMTRQEAQHIMDVADKDRDGRITYQEFKLHMKAWEKESGK